jgi:hypothetical protein
VVDLLGIGECPGAGQCHDQEIPIGPISYNENQFSGLDPLEQNLLYSQYDVLWIATFRYAAVHAHRL